MFVSDCVGWFRCLVGLFSWWVGVASVGWPGTNDSQTAQERDRGEPRSYHVTSSIITSFLGGNLFFLYLFFSFSLFFPITCCFRRANTYITQNFCERHERQQQNTHLDLIHH